MKKASKKANKEMEAIALEFTGLIQLKLVKGNIPAIIWDDCTNYALLQLWTGFKTYNKTKGSRVAFANCIISRAIARAKAKASYLSDKSYFNKEYREEYQVSTPISLEELTIELQNAERELSVIEEEIEQLAEQDCFDQDTYEELSELAKDPETFFDTIIVSSQSWMRRAMLVDRIKGGY